MGSLALAAAAVLAVLVIAFFAMRRAHAAGTAAGAAAPGAAASAASPTAATSVGGPCAAGACAFPAKCVAGACSDPPLAPLLVQAQNDARALLAAVQSEVLALQRYAQDLVNFGNAAAAAGLVADNSSLTTLGATAASDLAAASGDVGAYVQTLATPGCIPLTPGLNGPNTCGFCADIASLSTASPSSSIWLAAGEGAAAAAGLAAALQNYPAVIADLNTLVQTVTSTAVSNGVSFAAAAYATMGVVTPAISDDATRMGFSAANLKALAAAAQLSSNALNAHLTAPV